MRNNLVTARRDRVFQAMADAELDAMVLGRQNNTGYASGLRRLWTAGTRPFGAGCVVVRSTKRVHLLSSWDAGTSDITDFEDLYPLTWNPAKMAASMAAINGLANARRIGVDEFTPSFGRAAARFAPAAEIVAADDLMAGVRLHKMPGEVDAIRRSCATAWAGVEAALSVADGTLPASAAVKALARYGVTIPASSLKVERKHSGTWIDIAVMRDLYEGGVGGWFVEGARTIGPELLAACRPGAGQHELQAAATSDNWSVRGLGMGFERPVINAQMGQSERLEPGMVLSVTDGNHRDVIAVTHQEPEVLSQRPHPTHNSHEPTNT